MSRLGLIVAFLIVMGWVARFDGVTYQFRRFDRLVGVGGRAMRSRVCRAVLAGVLVALATNAATATANAATYGYDGSATACVGSLASGVGPQQSSASPGASTTPVANFVATNNLQAGEGGSFGELSSRGVVGDQITPHHMPQAAAGYTGYGEGGALAMEQSEHVLTRTYGGRGISTLKTDADLSFRQVLATDIAEVRSIVGSRYNGGLRAVIDYYRENFPNLMAKG